MFNRKAAGVINKSKLAIVQRLNDLELDASIVTENNHRTPHANIDRLSRLPVELRARIFHFVLAADLVQAKQLPRERKEFDDEHQVFRYFARPKSGKLTHKQRKQGRKMKDAQIRVEQSHWEQPQQIQYIVNTTVQHRPAFLHLALLNRAYHKELMDTKLPVWPLAVKGWASYIDIYTDPLAIFNQPLFSENKWLIIDGQMWLFRNFSIDFFGRLIRMAQHWRKIVGTSPEGTDRSFVDFLIRTETWNGRPHEWDVARLRGLGVQLNE